MTPLFTVTKGSRLYGTETETSDTDLCTVFLPDLAEVLTGTVQKRSRRRTHADGSPLSAGEPSGPGVVEIDFVPLTIFATSYYGGSFDARETAFSLLSDPNSPPEARELVSDLVARFTTANIGNFVAKAQSPLYSVLPTDTDVDFKAAARSLHFLDEAIELIHTGRITFPVKNRDLARAVRAEQIPLPRVLKEYSFRRHALEVAARYLHPSLLPADEYDFAKINNWLVEQSMRLYKIRIES